MALLKPNNILFVYTNFSSFVEADFKILSSIYTVDKYRFNPKPGLLRIGFQLVKQLLFLLINIWKYDVIYLWFADFHSLFPIVLAKILDKRTYVVNGGYDVARIRKYNYGIFCSPIRGFFAIQSMKNCTVNLPVSKFIERKVLYIAPKAACHLVYNSMNLEPRNSAVISKENMVLTIAIIDNERSFYLKGIDTFIETARLLPGYRFVIIGLKFTAVAPLLGKLPPNLEIHERIPHKELVSFYQKAKIYCQLSIIESFGVSVVEAMFHECYVIVTNQGALPEVVDEFGTIVKKDAKEIAFSIRQIFENTQLISPTRMRDHVMNLFSQETRKAKLIALINDE